MNLVVKQLGDADDDSAWDEFVLANDQATFFHRAAWRRVLNSSFGHRCHFLYAQREQQIVGVLPLAEVRSLLFGHSLSSLPFCVYGGIVAADAEAAAALRSKATELAESLQVGALELRNRWESGSGWPGKDLYVTFTRNIEADDDANLKAIPNRQRAMIRKGLAAGLQSDWDDGVDRLYRVYSESVRNLGTPVFSRRYLANLKREFADACTVLMISHEGRDVAGVMSFYFRDEVLPYYGGSTRAARQIKGSNDVMYWELLRRSREQGVAVFDFGRSKKGTGAYSFKKNWGFTAQPLPYEYHLVKSAELPDLNPMNPKYRLLVNTWQRLPLPVANALGPFIARSLG